MTREEYLRRRIGLDERYPGFFAREPDATEIPPGWLAIFEDFADQAYALLEGSPFPEIRNGFQRFLKAELRWRRVQFTLQVNLDRLPDFVHGPRKRKDAMWAVMKRFGRACHIAEERCTCTCEVCGDVGYLRAEPPPVRILCAQHRHVTDADLLSRLEELTG